MIQRNAEGKTTKKSNFNYVVKYFQLSAYLASKVDGVNGLLAFPLIAEAFKKSNATVPSSAAVERLFSAAAQVLTVRRCRMADEMIDMLIFLRSRLKSDIIML